MKMSVGSVRAHIWLCEGKEEIPSPPPIISSCALKPADVFVYKKSDGQVFFWGRRSESDWQEMVKDGDKLLDKHSRATILHPELPAMMLKCHNGEIAHIRWIQHESDKHARRLHAKKATK